MGTSTAYIESKTGKRGIATVISNSFTAGKHLVTASFKDGSKETFDMDDLTHFSYQSN